MSKEETKELKWKLESMEEKDNSPEVNISLMLNLHKEIPGKAHDEQPSLEEFEEEPAEYMDEAMMSKY